jgi:hypothetical protein
VKCNNSDVNVDDVAESFSGFFHDKIKTVSSSLNIHDGVYNRRMKLLVVDRFFMKEMDIVVSLKLLKPKKCEGYDQIP